MSKIHHNKIAPSVDHWDAFRDPLTPKAITKSCARLVNCAGQEYLRDLLGTLVVVLTLLSRTREIGDVALMET